MQKQKTHVLVAPLDWGLGHATRCIPILNHLVSEGVKISISASGGGKLILQQYFPLLPFIDIPGIKIRYPVNQSMALGMLTQLPAIFAAIRNENRMLEAVKVSHDITHVISDNRYGLYNNKIKTAFITHQVKIKGNGAFSVFEPFIFYLHKIKIEKFNELWIPDQEIAPRLSGTLSASDGIDIPVRFLGNLSRFKSPAMSPVKTYDYIALLSGPEPQRTLFENKVNDFFNRTNKKCLLIRGLSGENYASQNKLTKVMPTITDAELCNILHADSTLICRPGYSTLMDLAVLNHCRVLFVPTPGQTEQEYLAGELKNNFGYSFINQSEDFPLTEITPGKNIISASQDKLLQKTIGEFLS